MERLARYRKLVATLLLPIFLLATLWCVCLPAVAQAAAKSCHSQSEPEHGGAPADHDANCLHCGMTQLSAASSQELPQPTLTANSWFPPIAFIVAALDFATAKSLSFGLPEERPPPGGRALLSLKCAYLI